MKFEICKRCNSKSTAMLGSHYCVDCLPLEGTAAEKERYAKECAIASASAEDARAAMEEYHARTRRV